MTANKVNADLYLAQAKLADPGNAKTILVNKSLAIVNLVSIAAETRTLGRPTKEGVFLSLHFYTDGGDITLTVTGGFDENNTTSYTFFDPGQFILFQSFYDGTNYYWRKISDYSISNLTPAQSGGAVAAGVAGVAAGYKMARGEIALDGSNPTPVATGLTTIVSAQATLKRTSALSSGTAFVTVDFTGSDGTLNLYAWVLAGTASTGTESVEWMAIGT